MGAYADVRYQLKYASAIATIPTCFEIADKVFRLLLSLREASMADRIGQQLGNYRLTRLLGRGGFAEVYLGEHLRLGTQAAVKILYTRFANKDDVDSFEKEARTIAHLKHPHIVRVLDFDVVDDTPFLVMDYAAHGTLRQRHPKGAVLPLTMIIAYVSRWPMPCSMPTTNASSIATSNRRTCSWGSTISCCSRTLASPSWPRVRAIRAPRIWRGPSHTWLQSRSGPIHARPATSMPSAAASTNGSVAIALFTVV